MSRTIQYLHRCLKTIDPLFETKESFARVPKLLQNRQFSTTHLVYSPNTELNLAKLPFHCPKYYHIANTVISCAPLCLWLVHSCFHMPQLLIHMCTKTFTEIAYEFWVHFDTRYVFCYYEAISVSHTSH